jgi:hypothetical protein
MSIDSLLSAGYMLVGIGGILAITGTVLSVFTKTGPGTDPEITRKKPLVRLCIGIIFSGGFFLAIAALIFAALAIRWLLWDVIQLESPAQLAIYSLIIGPAPLVFPLIAEILARILGVDLGMHKRPRYMFWGINIGALLQDMMMAYLLLFVSGGLAMFGLLGSGIWALIRVMG